MRIHYRHIIISINTPSVEGFKYAVKYTDCATKMSWQWGLKPREGSELLTTMKKLVEEELPKHNIDMKHYHADGGKELISKSVREYLAKLKIKPKVTWTPRDTPELNAVSERKNRTDKEMTKAMLSRSGLPKAFWYQVKRGVIAAYRRLVTPGVQTNEEKDAIHVQDVAGPTKKWILENPTIDGEDSVPEPISMNVSANEVREPITMKEAKRLAERRKWITAAREEIKKLQKRKCWKVVKIPKHRKLVKSKFIFKLKRDEKGKITRFNVRLVARGFSQEKGADYGQTFSPMAKGVTVRLALAIAVHQGLQMSQIDIETAFP